MKTRNLLGALTITSLLALNAGCAGTFNKDNSDHFIYSDGTSGNNIYLYDAGDGSSKLVSSSAFIGDLSSDGNKVVYASSGLNPDIFTCNTDGSNVVQLTTLGTVNSRPVWSHDGNKILFHSNRDGNTEIYIMNADGTGQARLTNDPGSDTQASFNSDDSKIIWHSDRDGDSDIYTMSTDGSNVTLMTVNNVDDYSAAWLPDGTGFLYVSESTGNGDIYRYDSGTGTSSLVYGSPDLDGVPTASPNMARIYFAQRAAGFDRLCRVAFDGSDFQVISDPVDPNTAYINAGTTVGRF